jgi:hypothetical protein
VIPAATEVYTDFLFANVYEIRPASLAIPILSNTVLRIDPGQSGKHVGLVNGHVAVNIENTGAVAEFSLILIAGFDLNTVDEVEIFRATDADPNLGGPSQFGRFNLQFFDTITFTDITGAGKTHLEIAVKLSHTGLSNRTVTIGLSTLSYWQTERLSP